ncbi:MAG: DHA2 family efflux MFS transporter permease subunit [Pseudonocardiaceae bacterium]
MTRSAATPGATEPVAGTNGAARRATGDAPGSAADPAPAGGWALPLAVLIVGVFVSILDITIVNVAIPSIQNDFGATTDDVQWVVTAYALTEGVVVPVSAWLGDRFGLARVYKLALLGFAAGSALCGLAWSLESLVIFRIVQAMMGGILPAITMSILFRIVPRDRIGAAMGLYGLGVVSAPAIGPPLGGYLVEYADWRLIFFINVPIGILGVLAAAVVLPGFPGRPGRRFDVLGFLTVASGLFALLLAASKGPDWGWSSYRIMGLLVYGVLSLALFVVIELEVTEPLLDIRVFRYGAFAHSLLLIGMLMVVMYGVLFYIPLFLQQVQGFGAFDAGLTLLPQALVMAVLMPVSGQLYDRIGPRWLVVVGLAIVTASTYELHTVTIDTPREKLMWMLVGLGTGLGCSMMPLFTGGLAVLPVTQINTASAYNNVVQRVSGAIGLAVLTAIFTIQRTEQLAGRAALVPAGTATPPLGPGVPDWLSTYAAYQQTERRVFVGSMDDLFLICSALAALAALSALLLRSGPAPAAPAGFGPPAQEAATSPSANGEVAGAHDVTPSVSATANGAGNGQPARRTAGLVDADSDARPPER